jgi:AcrR family transcriptional regulator
MMDKVLNPKDKGERRSSLPSIVSSVLEAAALILPKHGYGKSTTNVIADKAGVSIGSLYYYFQGKDAIYRKLTDEVMTTYQSTLQRVLETSLSAEELHRALISKAVDFTYENRSLLRTLFALSPRLGKMEAVYDLRNSFAKRLAERLQALDGNESTLSYEKAYVLVNAINGVLDNYIYSGTCPLDREGMKLGLMKLVTGLSN